MGSNSEILIEIVFPVELIVVYSFNHRNRPPKKILKLNDQNFYTLTHNTIIVRYNLSLIQIHFLCSLR